MASPSDGTLPSFIPQWEKDLGIQFSPAQSPEIFILAHKSSLANQYQEVGYKILLRWYRVPFLLHKMDSNVSEICWRCNQELDTMTYIFWQRPLLVSFWADVTGMVKHLNIS